MYSLHKHFPIYYKIKFVFYFFAASCLGMWRFVFSLFSFLFFAAFPNPNEKTTHRSPCACFILFFLTPYWIFFYFYTSLVLLFGIFSSLFLPLIFIKLVQKICIIWSVYEMALAWAWDVRKCKILYLHTVHSIYM